MKPDEPLALFFVALLCDMMGIKQEPKPVIKEEKIA